LPINTNSNSGKPSKPSASASSPKKAGNKYAKGETGNANGRPKGSRNWATRISQQLIEGDAEEIILALIKKAKGGHFPAQKFLVERFLPPMRSRPISIGLPSIETPADIAKAIDQIWSAVGVGEITLDEAQQLLGLLDAKRRAISTADLAAEIEQIKEHMEIEK